MATRNELAVRIRSLKRTDFDAVVRIDRLHTGEENRPYWQSVLERFKARSAEPRIALGAVQGERLIGYVFGEVRAFEFGSDACGWIFAVGVDPDSLRQGIATALLEEARRRFEAAGVHRIRTMVRRDAVDVMRLFRTNGYVGGPYVQLELGGDASEEPRTE